MLFLVPYIFPFYVGFEQKDIFFEFYFNENFFSNSISLKKFFF